MTDEFSFVTVRTKAGWDRWVARNVRVREDGITLAKTPRLAWTDLGFAAIDLDGDPNGSLTALTESGDIDVYLPDAERVTPLTLEGFDRAGLDRPSLVATTATQLAVIDRTAGRVGVFSRRGRQLERVEAPFDDPIVAVGGARRVYVLDAGEGCVRAVEPDEGSAVVARGFESPVDLSIDDEESIYVLDDRSTGYAVVRSTNRAGAFDDPVEIPIEFPSLFVPMAIAAETDETIVFYGFDAEGQSGMIRYSLADHEFEAFSSIDESWATLTGVALRGSDEAETLVLRESESGRVWTASEVSDNRKDPETTRYEGRLLGRLDAGQRDVPWHRLTLSVAERDPGTRVDVQYYASNGETVGIDDFDALPSIGTERIEKLAAVGIDGLWEFVERSPSELSAALPETSTETIDEWLETARRMLESEFRQRGEVSREINPEDVLLDGCEGRYLHVEIRLVGQRRSSPRLASVTGYCPRRSYLRYLPEIYRKRSGRSQFLSQFLSLFESTHVDIEATIDGHRRYLDPQEIPADALPWLHEWLALEVGDGWPEAAQRELLSRATELYDARGTKRGILSFVEIYLDHVTRPERNRERTLVAIERRLDELVGEGYLTESEANAQLDRYRRTFAEPLEDVILFLEQSVLESIGAEEHRAHYSQLLGHQRRFHLVLRPSLSDRHVAAIERIVDSEKPAYTDARVERLDEPFQLQGHLYLGINTVLPNDTFVVGESTLGQEIRLDPDDGTRVDDSVVWRG